MSLLLVGVVLRLAGPVMADYERTIADIVRPIYFKTVFSPLSEASFLLTVRADYIVAAVGIEYGGALP